MEFSPLTWADNKICHSHNQISQQQRRAVKLLNLHYCLRKRLLREIKIGFKICKRFSKQMSILRIMISGRLLAIIKIINPFQLLAISSQVEIYWNSLKLLSIITLNLKRFHPKLTINKIEGLWIPRNGLLLALTLRSIIWSKEELIMT